MDDCSPVRDPKSPGYRTPRPPPATPRPSHSPMTAGIVRLYWMKVAFIQNPPSTPSQPPWRGHSAFDLHYPRRPKARADDGAGGTTAPEEARPWPGCEGARRRRVAEQPGSARVPDARRRGTSRRAGGPEASTRPVRVRPAVRAGRSPRGDDGAGGTTAPGGAHHAGMRRAPRNEGPEQTGPARVPDARRRGTSRRAWRARKHRRGRSGFDPPYPRRGEARAATTGPEERRPPRRRAHGPAARGPDAGGSPSSRARRGCPRDARTSRRLEEPGASWSRATEGETRTGRHPSRGTARFWAVRWSRSSVVPEAGTT